VRRYSTASRCGSPSLEPQFITGLVDAEGSFVISISPSRAYRVGWILQGLLSLQLHVNEIALLNQIQGSFGAGNINLHPNRDVATWVVYRPSELLDRIIPHFEKHPLQSQKRIDYVLWKQVIELMGEKAHLTAAGLEQIVSIRAAINLGLSDKLKVAFPDVKPMERPTFQPDEGKLDPHWILSSGFVTGEGSFNCSIRNSHQVFPQFSVTEHTRDLGLLLKIKLASRTRVLYIVTLVRPITKYIVSKQSSLINTILPHFHNYPLTGNKLATSESGLISFASRLSVSIELRRGWLGC
jgi:hypothetical protein